VYKFQNLLHTYNVWEKEYYLTEYWHEAYVQVVKQLAKYTKWQMRIAETRGAEL
jgi:hypothetical protein